MQQAQTLEKQNQILERWATNISKNNNLEINLFNKSKFGFRKGLSCILALIHL